MNDRLSGKMSSIARLEYFGLGLFQPIRSSGAAQLDGGDSKASIPIIKDRELVAAFRRHYAPVKNTLAKP